MCSQPVNCCPCCCWLRLQLWVFNLRSAKILLSCKCVSCAFVVALAPWNLQLWLQEQF